MKLTTAARTLLGKPFRHRGRGPNYYDCAGMAREAYRLNGVELDDFRLYSREPHQNGLTERIAATLGAPVRVAPVSESEIQVDDVLIFRFEKEPHHVGIATPYRFGGFGVIHACGHTLRVIEHRLSDDMVKRITHVFRRPV